jgi:hypothetical protein
MFAACFIFSYFCLCAETKFSIFFGAEPFDLAMGLWKLFTFFDPDLHCKLKFFSHLSLSLSLSPPLPLFLCFFCGAGDVTQGLCRLGKYFATFKILNLSAFRFLMI